MLKIFKRFFIRPTYNQGHRLPMQRNKGRIHPSIRDGGDLDKYLASDVVIN